MVSLELTNQYANILLLLNGLAIILYIGAKKKNRQRAMRFGNYETLQKVAGKDFLTTGKIILVTRLLALTTLIIGISSPVLVTEAPAANSDFVIAIDSSSSMLAGDLEPNRFEASKKMSREFVNRLGNGTSVGVITFSGSVKKEHELSDDLPSVSASIRAASTGGTAGTAMGNAISTGTSMLAGIEDNRTLVLITDGRNNVGTPVSDAVDMAVAQDVEIQAVGIGERNVSQESFGSVNGLNASRAAYPNLNVTQLQSAANRTGGSFTTVSNNTELREAVVEVRQSERRQDFSSIFILLAAALLLLEWVLGTTRYSIIP